VKKTPAELHTKLISNAQQITELAQQLSKLIAAAFRRMTYFTWRGLTKARQQIRVPDVAA
jgi:hypothetical protein